jgi:GDP/UDP-N,N'-diacetylbacillosamine 2-epimerase (hydrolysing)
MRHAITKMSHIHFVANDVYGKRVAQLGEVPKNIYLVGGLGVDSINALKLLERKELEETLGLKFKQKSLLITLHPSTLEDEPPTHQMLELLSVLSDRKDTTIIFTLPNSDTGGLELIKLIENFVQNNTNCYAFKSLGQLLYLSCMAQVDGVVGNSSSGITEAPVLKKGAINIGMRQFGRVQSTNVINCLADRTDIERAILKLYSSNFQEVVRKCKSPHGNGGASERIVEILCNINLKGLTRKTFYDLESSSYV